MFLDDELEEIFNNAQDKSINELSKDLICACMDRFGDPYKIGQTAWLNNIKRTELSWRLFAQKHTGFNEDWFKALLISKCGDALARALHW